jgi:hypothetical protein
MVHLRRAGQPNETCCMGADRSIGQGYRAIRSPIHLHSYVAGRELPQRSPCVWRLGSLARFPRPWVGVLLVGSLCRVVRPAVACCWRYPATVMAIDRKCYFVVAIISGSGRRIMDWNRFVESFIKRSHWKMSPVLAVQICDVSCRSTYYAACRRDGVIDRRRRPDGAERLGPDVRDMIGRWWALPVRFTGTCYVPCEDPSSTMEWWTDMHDVLLLACSNGPDPNWAMLANRSCTKRMKRLLFANRNINTPSV